MTDPTREQGDQGTPRTDAAEFHASEARNIMCVRADFARHLERDLNAFRSAGRREGLDSHTMEEAAKLCESRIHTAVLAHQSPLWLEGHNTACKNNALAIRNRAAALASAQPRAEEVSYVGPDDAEFGMSEHRGPERRTRQDWAWRIGDNEISGLDRRQPRAKAAEQDGIPYRATLHFDHETRVQTGVMPAPADRASDLVRDLAEHGLRFDLNPTIEYTADDDLSIGVAYLAYIKRMDESIRERALAALPSLPADKQEAR